MAHGAAHDPAQHIAAAFVRGQHAIGDEKGGGAQMIGDDAMAGLLRAVRIDAGGARDGADEGAHQIDIVIRRARPAAERRCARAPCRCRSRVAAARRARPARSARYCMKTRFQNSRNRSPSSSGLPGGPPAEFLALVVEDLRTGAAGPVSPIDQKLSEVAMRMIFESGKPAIFFQRAKASSSS